MWRRRFSIGRSIGCSRGGAPVPALRSIGQPPSDRATTGGLPLQDRSGNHGGFAPTRSIGQPRGVCPYNWATTGGLPLQLGNHGGFAPTRSIGQPRGVCPYKNYTNDLGSLYKKILNEPRRREEHEDRKEKRVLRL